MSEIVVKDLTKIEEEPEEQQEEQQQLALVNVEEEVVEEAPPKKPPRVTKQSKAKARNSTLEHGDDKEGADGKNQGRPDERTLDEENPPSDWRGEEPSEEGENEKFGVKYFVRFNI